jgi:GTPase KRas protein
MLLGFGLTRYLVLVRRVVEARRHAVGEVDGSIPYRTAALPPPRPNEMMSHFPNEKDDEEPKQSFWKRLRCW